MITASSGSQNKLSDGFPIILLSQIAAAAALLS